MVPVTIDKEVRILIGYLTDWTGQIVKLKCPRTGRHKSYLAGEATLLEISNCCHRDYGAWFAGKDVIEDEMLYLATMYDPAFLLLSILDQAKASFGGVFQVWEQLYETSAADYPPTTLKLLQSSLHVFCECRTIEEDNFFRLDDTRVLAFLRCKVHRVAAGLSTIGSPYCTMNSQELEAYAVGIISDNLSSEWQGRLRKLYGVAEPDVPKTQPLADLGSQNVKQCQSRPSKLQKIDPKQIARQRAAEAKAEKQAQQRRRETAGMKTMNSFFSKSTKCNES